jgi:hypothetical protein
MSSAAARRERRTAELVRGFDARRFHHTEMQIRVSPERGSMHARFRLEAVVSSVGA